MVFYKQQYGLICWDFFFKFVWNWNLSIAFIENWLINTVNYSTSKIMIFFQYTEWFLHGKQNPRPYVKIVKSGRSNQLENSAVSIIDADGGLGMDFSMYGQNYCKNIRADLPT